MLERKFRTLPKHLERATGAAALPSLKLGPSCADRQAACRATLCRKGDDPLESNDSARPAKRYDCMSKGAHLMATESGLTRRSFLRLSAAAVAAPAVLAG